MKQLQLNQVVSNGGDFEKEVDILGTFDSFIEDTDQLWLSNSNLRRTQNDKGDYNRVAVFIQQAGKDVVEQLPCSKQLSQMVRQALKKFTKSQVLNILFKMRVMKNKDTGYLFIIPEGQQGERITGKTIRDEKVTMEDWEAVIF